MKNCVKKVTGLIAAAMLLLGMAACSSDDESGSESKKTVATPEFSVAAGAVTSGTEVAITCATEGAVIHYTTNGEEPSAASTVYSTPVSITEACTVKAIAVKDGMNDSAVAAAEYTIASTVPEGFVEIKAGTFSMGSSPIGERNSRPVHSVTISKNYYICEHEVTQKEYETYCSYGGLSPSSDYGDGDNYPAYYVSWYDAMVYCNARSKAEGLTPCYSIVVSEADETDTAKWGTVPTSNNSTWDAAKCDFTADGYRLPTEAEWEYAARGGNATTDDSIYSGTADRSLLGNYAWYDYNASGTTHEVKGKTKNAYGIYDMSGNVWEWCWDWYNLSQYTTDSSGVTDPTGATAGSDRVYRGGCWHNYEDLCAVSYRRYDFPYYSLRYCGFRVVRTAK